MSKACIPDGYITKPIDTRKLPGQIAELLERSKQHTGLARIGSRSGTKQPGP